MTASDRQIMRVWTEMGYTFERLNAEYGKGTWKFNPFKAYDGGIGDCDCGKQRVNLTVVHGPDEVTLRFYNKTTKTGRTFALGSECLNTVERA